MFKIYRPISALLLVASLGSAWNAFASEGTIGETSEVNQQSGKVTGIVADDLGPVAGASVAVKGTSKGTITDSDGKFVLNGVKKGEIIQISFLGYTTQEIAYKGQESLDIKLVEDSQAIDEVVVTALGMKRSHKSLGYALTTIKGDEFTLAGKAANPLTSLYGKAAGVGIQSSAAGPTGGVNIKIRGAASLESSSKTRPLFVVDGVPIHDQESSMATRGYDPLNSFDYGAGINDINPEDIESMEILKGAKASVLYGSEGANGVVLITTKKGANTRGLGVTASFQYTVEQPVSYIDFQNEFGTGTSVYDELTGKLPDGTSMRRLGTSRFNFGPAFDGKPIMDIDGNIINYEAQPDNFMDFFRKGYSDNVNVAIAGGNEMGNMRVSYTNYKYQGILDNFEQKKNILSFSGKMNASKFATFEINSNIYNIVTQNRYPNIGGLVSYGINRDQPFSTLERLYKDDSGYKRNKEDLTMSSYASNIMDLLWHQRENRNVDDKFHMITSLKGKFDFHKNVFLVLQGGIDYTDIEYNQKARVTQAEPNVVGGKYSRKEERYVVQNYDAMLNFDKNFMKDRLNVLAFFGGGYRSNEDKSINVSTYGDMLYPDWYSLNNEGSWPGAGDKGKVRGMSRGSDFLYSLYGGVTLSLDERYYVEITGRNDWASTLPAGNNSYFYPGISFNWNFKDQIPIPQLQFGKIRMAWADAGRPASRYFANNVFSLGQIAETEASIVTPPSALFSGLLKPERKREYEIGMDLRFFDQNRLEFDFSYYTNNVYDQIMSVPLSSTSGYSEIRINAGNVHNYGYEIFLKGTPLVGKDFRWDVSFTAANQYAKVKKLYPGITQKLIGGGTGYKVVAEVGEPMGELLTYDYKKDEHGNRVVSSNGFYVLDYDAGFKKNSNINPSFIGGFNTSFYYKNFNINLGFDYKFGGALLSMSNYYLIGNGLSKESLPYRDEKHGGLAYYINEQNVKVPCEHNTTAPAGAKDNRVYHDGLILNGVKEDGSKNDIILSAYEYYSTFIHDMSADLQPDNIYKNDYIKFREIGISYTIPKRIVEKAKLQKVTLTATARNLFYLYKAIPNIDAESTLGTNSYEEYSFFPSTRSFGIGVSVSF
ncbi:SusC/RagA family TonB-linked outer membrane protein [uncultured Parabacteroides sp.]|uniref:SusC/RagA family TonB-linked outer membrane protein n=1 Tax=uncultured Parabacteroides sp. TaxID=512312 RepID=UPI002598C0F6|nr:SusC/RagA family TonB-linked outer membrane protein [uncultured Parabacteroides sp.]